MRERDDGRVPALVVSVQRHSAHAFGKLPVDAIKLLEGIGVEGDAHAGATVQHRSRVARDPLAPNLRQVHLLHEELFATVAAAGYAVGPGDLGENITTRGLDLLHLPVGTRLGVGSAVLTITGLRNPCAQINGYKTGLLNHVLRRGQDGSIEKLAGVMSIVSRGGSVRPGDTIDVVLPRRPHLPLTGV